VTSFGESGNDREGVPMRRLVWFALGCAFGGAAGAERSSLQQLAREHPLCKTDAECAGAGSCNAKLCARPDSGQPEIPLWVRGSPAGCK
jgi:hypothetical protein